MRNKMKAIVMLAGLVAMTLRACAAEALADDVRLTLDPPACHSFAGGAEWTLPVSLVLSSDRLADRRLTLWHVVRWSDDDGRTHATDPVENLAFKGVAGQSGHLTDVRVKLPAATARGTVGFFLDDNGTPVARASCDFATKAASVSPRVTCAPAAYAAAEWSQGTDPRAADGTVAGKGHGHFDYLFELPAGAKEVVFRAEVGVRGSGFLRVMANGAVLEERILRAADALVEAEIPEAVLAVRDDGRVNVRLEGSDGLIVSGATAGRYPIDPMLGYTLVETPAIDIGSRLEVFWDDCLVDLKRTTAVRRIHQPEYAGEIMQFDRPWEGDACGYHIIISDHDERGDFYRLYYRGWSLGMAAPENTEFPASDQCICYAESRDGIHWERPELGLHPFNGSTKNNIIMAPCEFGFKWDNLFVFKDGNPDCPADERYKCVAGHLEKDEEFGLWCLLSADGIHWRKGWCLTKDGEFDSQNVAFWDPVRKEYHCYYRYHHFIEPHDRHGNFHSRDIRHMVSKDFHVWSQAERLSYGDGVVDYPLYTNCVMPYPRTPHLQVAFPTRYVMRKAWTDNFDKLPSVENRRCRAKENLRYGIAITDCAFMVSRDGVNFQREEDAFMTPGPENPGNWLYGDCYPYHGLITVPGRRPGSDPELAFHVAEGYWSGKAEKMLRYVLRQDGFVSRRAPDSGAKLVTKPFVFTGSELKINFSTSAYGRILVTLREAKGDKAIHSTEIIGNKIDRVVGFTDGRVADFAGKPVVLEFEMADADIYTFQFVN